MYITIIYDKFKNPCVVYQDLQNKTRYYGNFTTEDAGVFKDSENKPIPHWTFFVDPIEKTITITLGEMSQSFDLYPPSDAQREHGTIAVTKPSAKKSKVNPKILDMFDM